MDITHRKKISAALKGKPHSATHNKNVSLALKGKPKSPAHRQKIADGVKRYHQNKKRTN